MGQYKETVTWNYGTLLSGIALNAAEATRTITIDVQRWNSLSLSIDYTNSAASNVQCAPYFSLDEGVTYVRMQSESISGGTGTLNDFTRIKAVSGDVTFGLNFPCGDYTNMKFIFDGASAGAGDLVTVKASGSLS